MTISNLKLRCEEFKYSVLDPISTTAMEPLRTFDETTASNRFQTRMLYALRPLGTLVFHSRSEFYTHGFMYCSWIMARVSTTNVLLHGTTGQALHWTASNTNPKNLHQAAYKLKAMERPRCRLARSTASNGVNELSQAVPNEDD